MAALGIVFNAATRFLAARDPAILRTFLEEELVLRQPPMWAVPIAQRQPFPYAYEMPRFFVTQQVVRYFEVVADTGEDANQIVFERYGGDPEVDFPVASVRTEKYETAAVVMSDTQRAEQL